MTLHSMLPLRSTYNLGHEYTYADTHPGVYYDVIWAEEAWRQTIELEYALDAARELPAERENFRDPPALGYSCAASSILEELQDSNDRGEIPEDDHEECARILGELWACELEDQRLLAAGYVWNEAMDRGPGENAATAAALRGIEAAVQGTDAAMAVLLRAAFSSFHNTF